jgi:hypothetical protein
LWHACRASPGTVDVFRVAKFIIRHLYRFKKCMPPSTEDNLGRRRFLLHRDKAVEHALERIRRAPDSQWESLTPQERAGLKEVLTEIWENCERVRWQQFCFSTLTRPDILRLVALGVDTRGRHHQICDASDAVDAILLSCSPGDRP